MRNAEDNNIIVTKDTEVAVVNNEVFKASQLQWWVYKRLEIWPRLVEACKNMVSLENTVRTRKQRKSQIARCKDILAEIDDTP